MSESFLSVFQKLAAQNNGDMTIVGDTLLVEDLNTGPVTKDIKGPDGKVTKLILETTLTNKQIGSIQDDRPLYVRVLAVGQGFYDSETGKDVPLDVQVGDILLLGKLSVRWLSTFGPLIREGGNSIGICRESDKILQFRGQAGYDRINALLGEAAKL